MGAPVVVLLVEGVSTVVAVALFFGKDAGVSFGGAGRLGDDDDALVPMAATPVDGGHLVCAKAVAVV